MKDIELIAFLRRLLAETDPQRQQDLARSPEAAALAVLVVGQIDARFLALLLSAHCS